MLITFIICLIAGLLWGILFRAGMASSNTPVDWPLALLGGIVFGLVFFLLYLVYARHQRKRIDVAIQMLPSPPIHSWIVLHGQGRSVQADTLFLCEDCLCLANTEKKTPAITIIPGNEFIRAAISSQGQLTLHMTDSRSLTLRTADAPFILNEMKQRGWLPFQH